MIRIANKFGVFKSVQEVGTTWAIPCNKIKECLDKSDENGCELPIWLLPSILPGLLIVLCLTSYIFLNKHIRNEVNTIKQDIRWRLATQNNPCSTRSKQLLNIAFWIETNNLQEIDNLFKKEMELHGNYGRTMCCFKVLILLVN